MDEFVRKIMNVLCMLFCVVGEIVLVVVSVGFLVFFEDGDFEVGLVKMVDECMYGVKCLRVMEFILRFGDV